MNQGIQMASVRSTRTLNRKPQVIRIQSNHFHRQRGRVETKPFSSLDMVIKDRPLGFKVLVNPTPASLIGKCRNGANCTYIHSTITISSPIPTLIS